MLSFCLYLWQAKITVLGLTGLISIFATKVCGNRFVLPRKLMKFFPDHYLLSIHYLWDRKPVNAFTPRKRS